jgi:alginate O-acetyltransferase complex protein AlgI
MVFSSLFFLTVFLPLNLLLYYITENIRVRNSILVVFSLFFYAWGEPIWISLLIFSALVDYLNGLFIERYRGKSIAKLGIFITLFINLGLLFTFKYSDFIVENFNFLFNTHFAKPGFLLPIGISFYTFQTISYSIDVYKGEVKAQKNFLNFLMFVSLYHQLVAGPIVRYSHIENEINNRKFDWGDFSSGVTRFSKGLFKKVLIANVAGEIVQQFLEKDIVDMTSSSAWFGISMYALQIYFDFSGYSDMAIGLGRMFGFHYDENFKHPYTSTSIGDFWRRWHISLGTFFRDYLYIPLGGNKKNLYLNLFIVWFCTGLWHGASWNFIIWGLYFCLILIAEKIFLNNILEKMHVIFKHIYALFFIIVGWAIFYFTDLNKLMDFLSLMFGINGFKFSDYEVVSSIKENIIWLIFALILSAPFYTYIIKWVDSHKFKFLNTAYLIVFLNIIMLLSSIAMLVNKTYNPFIYFRF